MKRTIISFMVAAIVGANAYAASGDETVVTSKKYVDDEMAKLQPEFSALGNNKLMVYSDTTDGAVLSRDIVTTLGTSTTDTSVPTRGAIVTGMNTKQDPLDGTAGWVVENTGTAGNVKQRPVYSATANYTNALVEAEDLNQMIIDAVNSELTQVADGWRINDSLTLPALRVLLDASIKGSANTSQNQSTDGTWSSTFSYGAITGRSVCIAKYNDSAAPIVATDTQNSELDSAPARLPSSPYVSAPSCWCKMETVAGQSNVSRWVRGYQATMGPQVPYSNQMQCNAGCQATCSQLVASSTDFRTLMFNTLQ